MVPQCAFPDDMNASCNEFFRLTIFPHSVQNGRPTWRKFLIHRLVDLSTQTNNLIKNQFTDMLVHLVELKEKEKQKVAQNKNSILVEIDSSSDGIVDSNFLEACFSDLENVIDEMNESNLFETKFDGTQLKSIIFRTLSFDYQWSEYLDSLHEHDPASRTQLTLEMLSLLSNLWKEIFYCVGGHMKINENGRQMDSVSETSQSGTSRIISFGGAPDENEFEYENELYENDLHENEYDPVACEEHDSRIMNEIDTRLMLQSMYTPNTTTTTSTSNFNSNFISTSSTNPSPKSTSELDNELENKNKIDENNEDENEKNKSDRKLMKMKVRENILQSSTSPTSTSS